MTDTRLPPHERELLVYRVICGYLRLKIDGQTIKVRSPSNRLKYEAQEVFQEYYDRAKEIGVEEDYSYLSNWTNSEEKRLEELKTDIEDCKIDLYNAAFQEMESIIVRSRLETLKLEQATLFSKKNFYAYLTCEGIASHAKRLFIIEKCSYLNGKRCDWSEISLAKVFNYCNEHYLTEDMYRELARTEPWGSIWRTRPKFKNLTEEQKYLILWSQQYDSIYKHPDCPPDDIIADNDMLDGWLILKRREREGRQGQSIVSKKLTNEKIAQSGEVYVLAESEREAKVIESMNSAEAKRIKQQRLHTVKEKGEVRESEMPDVIQDNMMKINQATLRHIRNK